MIWVGHPVEWSWRLGNVNNKCPTGEGGVPLTRKKKWFCPKCQWCPRWKMLIEHWYLSGTTNLKIKVSNVTESRGRPGHQLRSAITLGSLWFIGSKPSSLRSWVQLISEKAHWNRGMGHGKCWPNLKIPEDSRWRPEINFPPSIFLIRDPPWVLNDSLLNILRLLRRFLNLWNNVGACVKEDSTDL